MPRISVKMEVLRRYLPGFQSKTNPASTEEFLFVHACQFRRVVGVEAGENKTGPGVKSEFLGCR